MNKVNVCSSLQGQQIRPTQYSKSKIFAGKKIFVRRHKDTANQSSVQGGTHLVSVLKITNIETKKTLQKSLPLFVSSNWVIWTNICHLSHLKTLILADKK